jgi:hypothetical protein
MRKIKPVVNGGVINEEDAINGNMTDNKDYDAPKSSLKMSNLLKESLTNELFVSILRLYNTPFVLLEIFLTIFLLIVLTLAAYTTIDLVMVYLDYGVNTITKTVHETHASFPKVTFCNINQFTSKYAYEFLHASINESLLESSDHYSKALKAFLVKYSVQSMIKNESLIRLLSQDLDEVLLSCSFNYKNCDASDFKWVYDPYYGNCFSFNSGKESNQNKESTLPGYAFGLQLDFYVGFYESLSFFNSILGGRGAIIRIDNNSYTIDHALGGITVPSGFVTNVALKREFKESLPKPYGDCETENDSIFYKIIRNSTIYDYTQSFCLIQCLQELAILNCNCSIPLFVSIFDKTIRICASFEDFGCGLNIYFSIYNSKNYIQESCLPKCPLECYTSQITYATSSIEFLGDSYVDVIRKRFKSHFRETEINSQTVKENIVRLNVYYDTLSYTFIHETPQWNIIMLIATIGGNLGLFLGVSLLTLSEVIVALIEICFYKIKINTP